MVNNKLRLIKIYEIRGKVHPIEKTIIKLLDGVIKIPFYNEFYYMKDERYVFTYHTRTKKITLYTWDFKFKSSKYEVKEVMKYLLEKHFKLEISEVR